MNHYVCAYFALSARSPPATDVSIPKKLSREKEGRISFYLREFANSTKKLCGLFSNKNRDFSLNNASTKSQCKDGFKWCQCTECIEFTRSSIICIPVKGILQPKLNFRIELLFEIDFSIYQIISGFFLRVYDINFQITQHSDTSEM